MGVKANTRINDWLNDEKRVKGATKYNVEYIRALRECEEELGRVGMISYFCLKHLGMKYAGTMMVSAKKQKNLVGSVIIDLKQYKLMANDIAVFDRDIKSIHNRVKHIIKILEDDIRLTKYYPYFQEVGFDILMDYDISEDAVLEHMKQQKIDDSKRYDSVLKGIADKADEWIAEHSEEVKSHLASVADEIATIEQHRQKIKEDIKAETKARRDAIKAEKAEIKEMKKNAEKYRREEYKLDREIMINAGWANRYSYDEKYGKKAKK